MKIAMIGQKGVPSIAGGIEKHVEQLALGLHRAGHSVRIYARSTYPGAGQKTWEDMEIVRIPTPNTKNLNAIVYSFFATVHALFSRFDVIHYHGTGPAVMAVIPRILKPRTTIICTFHSDDTKHQKWGYVARTFFRLARYLAVRIPHATIAVSRDQLDGILHLYPEAIAHYIPNGSGKPTIVPAGKTLQKFGLTADRYILFTGRLVRHKGVHNLMAAFERMDARFAAYKLAIVGGSSYTDDYVKELQQLRKGNDRIIFAGQVDNDELHELLSNAALYAHPAIYEGLSISILEALSYGLITLVSDIPANAEAVGSAGFTFKKYDVKDLAQQMEKLLAYDEATKLRMREAAAEFARQHYDWDSIVKQTLELYDHTLLLKHGAHKLAPQK